MNDRIERTCTTLWWAPPPQRPVSREAAAFATSVIDARPVREMTDLRPTADAPSGPPGTTERDLVATTSVSARRHSPLAAAASPPCWAVDRGPAPVVVPRRLALLLLKEPVPEDMSRETARHDARWEERRCSVSVA
eukprot:261868-Prymnesium_polylepis.1